MVKITVLLNRELVNQEKNQMTIICLLVGNSSFITLIILKDNSLLVHSVLAKMKNLKSDFLKFKLKSHISLISLKKIQGDMTSLNQDTIVMTEND